MLPDLLDSRIHIGVLLALLVCVVVHLVFARTSFGTRLDVLGANPRAALHLGIDVPRLIVVAFLISGALIGLAAATDIQGELAYMRADWNPAYGLAVVPLVFLARLNALALIPVALFFTMLSVGGLYAAREARLPTDFVLLFMGILLLFMVGTQYLSDKLARGERVLVVGRAEAWLTSSRPAFLTVVITTGIAAGVPLLFASLGEIVAEQGGILNVGLEGMMLAGAFGGFITAISTGDPWLGLLGGRPRGRRSGARHGRLLHPPRDGPDRRRHRHRARGRGRHEHPPSGLVRTLVPERAGGRGVRHPGPLGHPGPRPLRLLAAVAGLCRPRPRRRHHAGSCAGRASASRFAPRENAPIRSMPPASASCGCGRSPSSWPGSWRGSVAPTSRSWPGGTFVPHATDGAGFIAIVIAMLARGRAYWSIIGALLYGMSLSIATALQLVKIEIPTAFVFMLPFLSIIIVLVLFARQSRLPAALGLPYHRGSR